MIWFIIGLFVFLFVLLVIQNEWITITSYTITIPELHKKLKGKKIVHLSDIHLRPSTRIKSIESILKNVESQSPDIITITGDLVQAGLDDFVDVPIRELCEGLSNIAPTYYVTGNHDIASGKFEDLDYILKSSKVQMLIDEAQWVSFGTGNTGVVLSGLAERINLFAGPRPRLKPIELTEGMQDHPKILLAHHPEFFKEYLEDKRKAPDLTLTGHTHGGQIRLPILGGLFAPGQGFNPHYDYGLFSDEENPYQRMIVSGGLGSSSFPLRINNRPEIVVITLN